MAKNIFVLILAAASVAVVVFGLEGQCIADNDELYTYKVSGQCKQTGYRVEGYVRETDKSGNLVGNIYDELDVIKSCPGVWHGKGVAKFKCSNGREYVVTVVED